MREGETLGNADDGGLGFVDINSSLSTVQLKISESNPLSIIAYRDSAKCVCVCVLPIIDSDLERVRLFLRTRPEVLNFGRESIDEKGMERREERREGGRGSGEGGSEGRRGVCWIER